MHVLPIIAVAHVNCRKERHEAGKDDDVLVLVYWKLEGANSFPSTEAEQSQGITFESQLEGPGLSRPFQPPQQSKLQSQWISLRQALSSGDCCVFGLDTLRGMQECATLSHHWTGAGASELAPSSSQKSGKEGKKKQGATPAVKPSAERYFEPSGLHPTLLSISVPKTTGEASAQEVSLRVFLQADLINAIPLDGNEALSSSCPSVSAEQKRVVLVLQEFDPSLQDSNPSPPPRLYEISLDVVSLPIPMLASTITIPTSGQDTLLLWVRLLTPSSIFVKFNCTIPLHIGDIDTIWMSFGGHVVVKEGNFKGSAKNSEQLLFRATLGIEDINEISNEKNKEHEEEELDQEPSIEGPNSDTAVLFFHVADEKVGSNIKLFCSEGDDKEFKSLNGREGLLISLPMRHCERVSLVAKTTSSSFDILPCKWKMILLLRKQNQIPSIDIQLLIPEKAPLRFSGHYAPNNRLMIIRDVFTVVRSSPPLALQLSVHQSHSEGVLCERPSNVALQLSCFRKSDGRLLYKTRGEDTLTVYSLPQDLSPSEGAGLVGTNAMGAQSGGDKGKEKKVITKKTSPAAGLIDAEEIVIEALIDESSMKVPESWCSKLPHRFDNSDIMPSDGCLSNNIEGVSMPVLIWTLDVLDGSVVKATHDVSKLEECNAMKLEWEAIHGPGRLEKANAALAYFKARMSKAEATESAVADQQMLLAKALESDISEIKDFEEAIRGAPKVHNLI